MSANDTSMLSRIEASAGQVGSGQMEILLFSLGTRETFGINVFKVREVSQTPAITRTPNMPVGVEGVISMRGHIIPVISLATFIHSEGAGRRCESMIVTEFNRGSHAFLVDSVDRIIRVDWEKVRSPEKSSLAGTSGSQQGLVTAVTELEDGKLVSILDVEQILADMMGETAVPDVPRVALEAQQYVFFCDDSIIARKEISGVLDKMGVRYQQASNGREALERLTQLAQRQRADGSPLSDSLKIILVDAEMPEMDGYTLTRRIKADARFSGIPVIMHSSLSSNSSRSMGDSAGVDGYVAKFDPLVLANTLIPLFG
jgi:two-component system chemotaxis response regulator CheV